MVVYNVNKINEMLFDTIVTGKILAEITTLWKAGIDPTADEFVFIEELAATQISRTTQAELSEAIIMSRNFSLMDKDPVDYLMDNIKKIRERLGKTYRNPNESIYERQRTADICRRELCWHIREIRKNSGGVAPQSIEDAWGLHLCDRFIFLDEQ
jgi:hypothetical protein